MKSTPAAEYNDRDQQAARPPLAPEAPGTTLYYDRGGVQVTSHELIVHGRRYQLDRLGNLRIARGSTSRATLALTGLAFLFLLLGSSSWSITEHTATASVVVIVVGLLGLIAALVSRRIRPRPYELWAEYRRNTVQLLWSRDERIFNQIRFAVLRALQARR